MFEVDKMSVVRTHLRGKGGERESSRAGRAVLRSSGKG